MPSRSRSPADRQQSADRINARWDVRLNAVSTDAGQPLCFDRHGSKAQRTVASCAGGAHDAARAGRPKPRDVLSKFDFGRKDLFFRRSGKADMLCAGVNAQCHALLRFPPVAIRSECERRSSSHCVACLPLSRCPALQASTASSGPTAHVQNKYFQSILADTCSSIA